MADEVTSAADAAIGEVAAAADPKSSLVSMSPEQLRGRLEEEREKGRSRILKDLGFEKAEDAKNAFKVLKELQDAQLTEQQRTQKALEDLKPRAERTTALEAQLAALVDEQFVALPEATQKAIDSVANGNAEERLKLMRVMRAAGALAAPAATATTAAPQVTPPTSTAAGASPPRGALTKSKADELKELEAKNPMAASIFYAAHRQEIERERPAS